MALANMVRKDNPNWTPVQIKDILPELVAQLQVILIGKISVIMAHLTWEGQQIMGWTFQMQLSANNFSLYNKVQDELRAMQLLQEQRMRESMLKQYHMHQMLQNQQVANQLLGNLHITPEELRHIQVAQAMSQNFPQPGRSNEIIDLN